MLFFMIERSGGRGLMLARWSWGRRGAVLIGIAALAGAIAGVYVSGALDSKDAVIAGECRDAAAVAERLDPLAKGEVAAFRVARAPERLADLAFHTPEGGETSLAAFAGRLTLVNLWATWCVPCRTEMPALDNLEKELGGEDFEVVAVNIDLGAAERARAFLDEIGVERLAFYSDPSARLFPELKRRGLAFGLPTTLLIDGKGCRIGSVEGPAEWDSEDAKALIRAALDAARSS
jgi:thiol-disulfide isomerase/thioredoxin